MQKGANKRGQVTIFIIIAILVVGIVALIFFLVPRTTTETGFNPESPEAFMQNCLDGPIEDVVSTVSAQGGSVVPEFYFMYGGERIEYLCYTNEYYKTCVVQQPMLKQHIESEISDAIVGDASSCFTSLQENYRADGYSVELQQGITNVELLPKRIVVSFPDYVLTTTKGETARHDAFSVVLNNNLYELTSIANSIIDWESREGDAETTTYMSFYKYLKVEKKGQLDGTTIYILTDKDTGNKFQFASRSNAASPDYGLAGISPA